MFTYTEFDGLILISGNIRIYDRETVSYSEHLST